MLRYTVRLFYKLKIHSLTVYLTTELKVCEQLVQSRHSAVSDNE